MQNYKKYFNVASDINIFLIIVHFILKKITTSNGADLIVVSFYEVEGS